MVAGLPLAADDEEPDEDVSDVAAAAIAAEAAPPPSGEAALGQALLLFEDGLGLPMPPVPRELAGGVRVLGPGFVGTREDALVAGGPDWFLADLAGRPADYLVAGFGGHGLNSRHVHYALALGPLAVFVQIRAGGVHGDPDLARARVERAFTACADLIEAAAERSPLPPGERLVAVEIPHDDDRRLGRVGPGGVVLEPSEDPLAEMLAILG